MKNSRLLQAFDVFFIMILCFLTLLTTMLAQGRVLVGAGGSGESFVYVLDLKILLPMFLILISYFFIVCRTSDKSLRMIIKHLYDKAKSTGEKKEVNE